nr:60s ribosomal protein l13a-1 [Quercus suber]
MSSRSSTTIQHLHNTVSPSSNHSLDIPIMVGHKYCLLGKLSSKVGWNHYDTIKIAKRRSITSSCEQSK